MEMFQPKFPGSVGSNPIRFLRVLKENDIGAVAKVTHHPNQTLEVISECKITYNPRGHQVFVTAPGDAGHLDLCKLLSSKGINGGYLGWLSAVEDGNDALAEERRAIGTICFELDSISEKSVPEWTIL